MHFLPQPFHLTLTRADHVPIEGEQAGSLATGRPLLHREVEEIFTFIPTQIEGYIKPLLQLLDKVITSSISTSLRIFSTRQSLALASLAFLWMWAKSSLGLLDFSFRRSPEARLRRSPKREKSGRHHYRDFLLGVEDGMSADAPLVRQPLGFVRTHANS